jgi:hypothetical protein
MTRQDLLDAFNGCPDGPMRLLRRVKSGQTLLTGNHNCRRALVDAGFLTAEREGRWWRVALTPKAAEVEA